MFLLLYEIIITQKVPKSQIFQGFLALFTFKKDKSEATNLGLCLQSEKSQDSLYHETSYTLHRLVKKY